VFADSAAEVLPPTAPAAAAEGLARFFSVPRQRGSDPVAAGVSLTYASPTPWSDAFVGNTDIPSGLDLARELLTRGVQHPAGSTIVLISDLQDGGISSRFAHSIKRAVRAGIDVRALPVGAMPDDIARWQSYGGSVDLAPIDDRTPSSAPRAAFHLAAGPAGILALCALAFAALLCGLYFWAAPVRVTAPARRPEGSGA
jgi:hypothetical protein